MPVIFRPFQKSDEPIVAQYSKDLYSEDVGEEPMTDEKIQKTFSYVQSHPDAGVIYIFELDSEVAGYAIVMNFWSNEYGGIVLDIDEIFVSKFFRSHGIGSQFFEYLKKERPNNAIAMALEVLPSNHRAEGFYKKLGFKKSEYSLYRYIF